MCTAGAPRCLLHCHGQFLQLLGRDQGMAKQLHTTTSEPANCCLLQLRACAVLCRVCHRRVLQLSERDEDVTSINRITGAANWPMPGSLPSSLPTSPQPGSWAAAARRGADAEAAAAAEGGSSRPVSAAGKEVS
jgi:hypothetical protein